MHEIYNFLFLNTVFYLTIYSKMSSNNNWNKNYELQERRNVIEKKMFKKREMYFKIKLISTSIAIIFSKKKNKIVRN